MKNRSMARPESKWNGGKNNNDGGKAP